jgi:hypothetical protein
MQQNFSAISMIIHYLEKEAIPYDIEGMTGILQKYPKYGLGMNIQFRIDAYAVLCWVMEHPETDFKKLDSWHVQDNESYFQKMPPPLRDHDRVCFLRGVIPRQEQPKIVNGPCLDFCFDIGKNVNRAKIIDFGLQRSECNIFGPTAADSITITLHPCPALPTLKLASTKQNL